MKARSVFISIALGLLLGLVGSAQTIEEPLITSGVDRSFFLRDVLDESALRASLGDKALSDFPVYQMSIFLMEETQFTGTLRVLYKNRTSAGLERLVFNVFPNTLGGSTSITDVYMDGQTASFVSDAHDSSIGWIDFPAPLQPGESTVVELRFSTRVPREENSVDPRFCFSAGILNAAYSFPVVAGHDGADWDTRRPPMIGEFSFGEHALFSVNITAPADFAVVASGTEIYTRDEGYYIARKVVAGPVTDFYWGGSYRFDVHTATAGDVALRCFAPSYMATEPRAALFYAGQALLTFSQTIEPYPFRELDVVISPPLGGFWGGAQAAEFGGVFTIGWDVWEDSPQQLGMAPFDLQFNVERVVVHEVAHQWFAGVVRSDPIAEPWLDESLAELATWMYFGTRYGVFGVEGFRAVLLGSAGSEFSLLEPVPLNVSTEVVDSEEYGPLVYAGGALVLWEAVSRSWSPADTTSDVGRFLALHASQNAWRTVTTEGFLELAKAALGESVLEWLSLWVQRK